MSVSNGQQANANTFNNAFMSRTTDTDTIGKVDLNNADSAAISDVQQQINDNIGNIATNTADIATNASDIAALDVRVTQNENDLANINGNFVDLTTNQTIAGEKTFSDNMVIDGDLEVNGTTTTVNSQELDVADATITINNGGTDASSEGAGVTIDRVGTDGSIAYENALDNKFKIGDLGSEVEVSGVIKDTEANILALVSPSTSQKYYAFDTGKYFVYDAVKSAFLELGSGSGIGSPSIYGLFNAENEDLTGFVGASINSVSPIAGEFSYDLTFPGNAPSVTVQERSSEKLNQLKFQAKITSGTCKFIVKDQSSNVLDEVEFNGSSSDVILQWFMGDSITSIQLEWEDVSSATGVTVDDIFCDDNFINFKDVNKFEQIKTAGMQVANFWDSVSAGENEFDESLISGLSGSLVSVVNSGGQDRITANQDLLISAAISQGDSGTNGGPQILNSSDEVIITTKNTSNDHNFVTQSGTFLLEKDDYIYFSTLGTADSRSGGVHLVMNAKDQNIVSSSSGVENTFSARVQNNGTATVTSESFPFIDTVSRDSLGKVTVNFKPGFFTQIPAISLTTDDGPVTSVIITPANTPTASSVQIETWNEGAGAYQDRDFVIKVQRQGDDYKNPQAFALNPSLFTCKIFESQTSGTNGGTFTSGAYQTRVLNQIENGSGFAALSSNQFTLQKGEYEIEVDAPAFRVDRHKAQLFNITDSTVDALGSAGYSANAVGGATTFSFIKKIINIIEPKTFEIRHRCETTDATTGFGVASSFGDDEMYTQISIRKLR